MEHEEQYNIKIVRLHNLEAVEDSIANRDLEQAKVRMNMFLQGVKDDSEAGRALSAMVKEIKGNYDADCTAVYNYANNSDHTFDAERTNGLPVIQWRDEKLDSLHYTMVMAFHKACWDVSLHYGLIPLE